MIESDHDLNYPIDPWPQSNDHEGFKSESSAMKYFEAKLIRRDSFNTEWYVKYVRVTKLKSQSLKELFDFSEVHIDGLNCLKTKYRDEISYVDFECG